MLIKLILTDLQMRAEVYNDMQMTLNHVNREGIFT